MKKDEAVLIEAHASGNQRAVVAFLLALAALSLWIFLADSCEVRVGQVIQVVGALQRQLTGDSFLHIELDCVARTEQLVADPIIAILVDLRVVLEIQQIR